jgi:hypothetical protein
MRRIFVFRLLLAQPLICRMKEFCAKSAVTKCWFGPRETSERPFYSAECVIPKPRAFTSGARDLACSVLPSRVHSRERQMFTRHRQSQCPVLEMMRSARDPSLHLKNGCARNDASEGSIREKAQTFPRLHHDQSAPFPCFIHGRHRQPEPSGIRTQEQTRSRFHQPIQPDASSLLRGICLSRRSHQSREGNQGMAAKQEDSPDRVHESSLARSGRIMGRCV